MKQQKQSMLIHVWENYEFYLYIPETISRNSKPFIFYHYKDLQTEKSVRIKKFIGQCNGDRKLIQKEAKKTLPDIIELLEGNWNPVRNTYNELKITPLSTIKQCMDYWLLSRERSLANASITPKKLKGDKILMMHFEDYMRKQGLLNVRATTLTSLHIKDFLETKASERNWGKVSYNSYRVDIGTFFNFLIDLTI